MPESFLIAPKLILLDDAVGRNRPNQPADVRAIQERLNELGQLSTTALAAERPGPTATKVKDADLPQTIAAIEAFQRDKGMVADGWLTPNAETHRLLMRPDLPARRALTLTHQVGQSAAADANIPLEVRNVQRRLRDLGLLAQAHYLAEQAANSTNGHVAPTALPRTIAAIRRFQQEVTGKADGVIDPDGRTLRALIDPTYGTFTHFNPEADNLNAGPAFDTSQSPGLQRIISAIERHESAGLTGEAPAVLLNAAGTPASFGRAQLIGSTAVGLLRQPRTQWLRDFYDLDMPLLNLLDARALATRKHYDDIYDLVDTATKTAAQIAQLTAAYRQANAVAFRRDTGLSDRDIVRMFHIAQLRRRINALPAIGFNELTRVRQAAAGLLTNAHFKTSYDALEFNQTSLEVYIRLRSNLGENRAGFQTKAVFSHPESQRLRRAMTDAGGRTLGRVMIQESFEVASQAVPANQPQRERAIALLTAYRHNHGSFPGQNFTSYFPQVATDVYAQQVVALWDEGMA